MHCFKPDAVKELLENGHAILVDVREPSEHDREYIEGALLHPTSTFDEQSIPQSLIVIFHCKTGRRSLDAANRFSQFTGKDGYHLEGGIEAWKKAGYPTKKL